MRSGRLRTGAVAVTIIVALGISLRVWVLTSHLGTLSADEAYTGLQARAILDGRFPVVIDGMTYTAVLESYLFAPFVALFGLHVVPLKWLSTVGWVMAAWFTARAVNQLAPSAVARAAAAMVWLAPGAMLVLSTRAYVGYASGVAAVSATMYLTIRLVDDRHRLPPSPWQSALVGGTAGLAIYCHPMFLTVVLPMLAVPSFVHRRHLRHWWLPSTCAALVVNLPFLVWNAARGWPSLDQPAQATESAVDRLTNFATGLVPRTLGLRAGDGTWVHTRPLGLMLYGVVVALAVWGVIRTVRRRRAAGAVLAAPLIMSWPLMSGLSNLSFVADGRYGIITFVFLVAAIALGALDVMGRWHPGRTVPVLLTLWVLLFTVPWMVREAGGDLGDPNDHVHSVIDVLETEGFDRVLGTYWWVLPIDLISQGRILTGTAGHPPVVLLPRTQALVEASPDERVAFVFAPDAVDVRLLRLPEERYERRRVAGAVVFIPRG